MYTSSRATTSGVPHVRHTPVAVVISTPNSSSIRPPMALPSSRRSSATGRSETLGPDRQGLVAERDQPIGRRLDETGRAADEDMRSLGGRPRDLAQKLGVDAPCVAGPARGLGTRQRVKDLELVGAASLELLVVDHVLECPRRVEE